MSSIKEFIFVCAVVLSAGPAAGRLHVQSRPVYLYQPDLDSICLVSFPFTINREDFQFLPDSSDGSMSAGVFAELTISDSNGRVLSTMSNNRAIRVQNFAEAKAPGYKLFDRFMKGLRPGVYGAKLTVIDIVSKREETLDFGTIVVSPWDGSLKIGAEVAAYRIDYVGDSVDEQTARLVDNGYLVLPNPLGVYNLTDSALWVYAEMYGLHYDSASPGNYRLAFTILDPTDQVVRDFGYTVRPMPGNSAMIAEKFSLDGLARGGFRLRTIVADINARVADTSLLTFWRIESEADLRVSRTAFDSLLLKDQVAAMRYLMTPSEVTTLESLPVEGQRNFIRQYWQEHDAQKSAVGFVSQDEIVRRYRFVNETFSTNEAKNNGWKSDRGRIYMKYGPWEERTDQTIPSEGTAYDIWHYRSIKGGYFFVFVDVRGISDFRMVHSNATGERYDAAWEEYFKTQLYMHR
jgi:GWxTD domain-containing protein